MGFLDSVGDVLSGWPAVAMQDKYGPDWRQQRAAKDFALQQQQAEEERASREFERQQEEADITGLSEAALAPGVAPETMEAGLGPEVQGERRKFNLARAQGRSAQAKSSLASQKANTDWMLRQLGGEQRLGEIEARGVQAEALARVRADLEAGRQPSPRDLALIEKRGEIQTDLFNRAERGRNTRFERGLQGRRQLRQTVDENGNPVWDWIDPGESRPAPPTATQRETAGMAQNIQDVTERLGELAPEVASGPVMGNISKAWQSQYPGGAAGEFDAKVRQLIDLAYIQSGKQINKQELELKLKSLINRGKGNVPFQVQQAEEYINKVLEPYRRSGAVKPPTKRKYRLKPGANPDLKSSYEEVP